MIFSILGYSAWLKASSNFAGMMLAGQGCCCLSDKKAINESFTILKTEYFLNLTRKYERVY
jgi:hypothetical protein